MKSRVVALICSCGLTGATVAAATFEGKIEVAVSRGGQTTDLLYTVGDDALRIEVTGGTAMNPIDLVERRSGALTLLYPHNRSVVRLNTVTSKSSVPSLPSTPSDTRVETILTPTGPRKPVVPATGAGIIDLAIPTPPGVPSMPPKPQMPAGLNPQSAALSSMPPLPPMMNEKIELKATGKKEKILGYLCEQFEVKQRGQILEIWATDQLFPYQPYLGGQPPQFGPQTLEEVWPQLLTARKLFPLRVILRPDPGGPERLRLEVKSVTPQKIEKNNADLFRVPADYVEIEATHF